MIWPRLAVSLLILFVLFVALLGGLGLLTLARAASREKSIAAEFPPGGEFLSVNGATVHAYISGNGPDLILLHGASGNARDMTFALAADLAKSYRVIAFDRPGLGWSDAIPDQSLSAQAQHLSAAATQLGVTDPLIVGQSYGGSVCLAWALYAPMKPQALVLISAPSLPWLGKLDPWYRATSSRPGAALIPPLAVAFVTESYIAASIQAVFAPDPVPAAYAETIAAPLTLRRDNLRANFAQVNALRDQIVVQAPLYGTLTLPIEILHGSADTIVPLHVHSQPLAALLPNAHLTVLRGAGHMPHYGHRGAVLAAIARAALRAPLRSP